MCRLHLHFIIIIIIIVNIYLVVGIECRFLLIHIQNIHTCRTHHKILKSVGSRLYHIVICDIVARLLSAVIPRSNYEWWRIRAISLAFCCCHQRNFKFVSINQNSQNRNIFMFFFSDSLLFCHRTQPPN